MIILINAPALLHESMLAARMRIAHTLGCPADWVRVQLLRGENGTLHPKVDVEAPAVTPPEFQKAPLFQNTPEWRREVVEMAMANAMKEFRYRREGARA